MTTTETTTHFDVERIRADFPILHQEVNGRPLVYFDNAATTQKPQAVIDALVHYYTHDNANIHRGVHTLAERATSAYEATREATRAWLNAEHVQEIIFTRGTTESINLVAGSWGRQNLRAGDEVILSGMEHHSHIVPWQMVCEAKGAHLKVIPVLEDGTLDLDAYNALLNERTRIVSVVHASNALGTVNPVREIARRARA
ncbi:MAG: aminotransferase class V-fold PLP-dependent enzyme, partial [Catalinimonas sp.]